MLNYEYFIAVADTLNITRAAQKLYVSPQNISSYIKRLEEQMGVTLFKRKPAFTLTPEGHKLYSYIKKMQAIELEMREDLSNGANGKSGSIHMGIDQSRGQMIMKDVYATFHLRYPKVSLVMYNGFTPDLVSMVLRGEIEFFLGPYWYSMDELECIRVMEESYYYVVSDKLLIQHFGTDWEQEKENMCKGVDLPRLAHIPMILPRNKSFMYQQIIQLLNQYEIIPEVVIQNNEYRFTMEMAANGYGACFCPEMIVPLVINGQNSLCAYPIKGLLEKHMIYIVYYKGGYLQKCSKNFIRAILDAYGNSD